MPFVAGGCTVAEAARLAKIPLRSAERYAAREDFREAVRAAQATTTEIIADRYRSLGAEAVALLGKVLYAASAMPVTVKNLPTLVRVAREAREAVTSAVEMSDVLRRLDALEAAKHKGSTR